MLSHGLTARGITTSFFGKYSITVVLWILHIIMFSESCRAANCLGLSNSIIWRNLMQIWRSAVLSRVIVWVGVSVGLLGSLMFPSALLAQKTWDPARRTKELIVFYKSSHGKSLVEIYRTGLVHTEWTMGTLTRYYQTTLSRTELEDLVSQIKATGVLDSMSSKMMFEAQSSAPREVTGKYSTTGDKGYLGLSLDRMKGGDEPVSTLSLVVPVGESFIREELVPIAPSFKPLVATLKILRQLTSGGDLDEVPVWRSMCLPLRECPQTEKHCGETFRTVARVDRLPVLTLALLRNGHIEMEFDQPVALDRVAASIKLNGKHYQWKRISDYRVITEKYLGPVRPTWEIDFENLRCPL